MRWDTTDTPLECAMKEACYPTAHQPTPDTRTEGLSEKLLQRLKEEYPEARIVDTAICRVYTRSVRATR